MRAMGDVLICGQDNDMPTTLAGPVHDCSDIVGILANVGNPSPKVSYALVNDDDISSGGGLNTLEHGFCG